MTVIQPPPAPAQAPARVRPTDGTRRETSARGVLIVSQPTTEGVAVCVRELTRAAVAVGYDVTVACPGNGHLAGWATEHGAHWEPIEMRRSPHPSDIQALVRLRELIREHALVHLHSSKAGA